MQTVKLDRDELKSIVVDNRNKHRAIFEEAQESYRKMAIEELEKMLKDAKAGRVIKRSLSLIQPTDQTRDYDRVIRMLELSADKTISLTEHEFACYVLDDWGWKRQFLHSNRLYSQTASAAFMAEGGDANDD